MTLSGSWGARGKELRGKGWIAGALETDSVWLRDQFWAWLLWFWAWLSPSLGLWGNLCGGEEEQTAGDSESLSIELFWWLEFGRWLGNWGAGGDWVDKASIGLGSSGELDQKNLEFTFGATWPSREGLPRGFLVLGSSWIKDGFIFKVREIWR